MVAPDPSPANEPLVSPEGKVAPLFSAERSKQLLTILAELVTVFGFVGFLGSIFLNSYVFQKWSLSFLQVASLSDVVMSGLQLSIDLAMLSLLAVLGYGLGRGLYRSVRSYEFPAKSAKQRILAGTNYVRVGVTLLLIAISLPTTVYVLWRGVGSIYLLDTIAFCIGFVVGNINRAQFWTSEGVEFAIACSIASIVFALFLYLYVQAFLSKDSVIGGGVEDGFLSKRHVFRTQIADPTCPTAAVLWIGERSLVARCDGSRRIILIENGSGNLLQ